MKRLNSTALKRSVTFSVTFAMITLVVIIVISTSLIQKQRQKQLTDEYSTLIHKSIEHAINHYIKDYTYRLHGFVLTTPVSTLLQAKDREGMYELYKPKWDLLKEEEHNFNIMHIHLADGTSFLRMHEPEHFGDRLDALRPMIKEIHTSHKLISGYEVGKYESPFRVIEPIFDADEKYIGALEIGLEPTFILDALEEIKGLSGLLFIKSDNKEEDISTVGGYRLHSPLSTQHEKLYKILQTNNQLKDAVLLNVDNKTYLTHLFTLNDFQGEEKVKILFFQDLSHAGYLRVYLLIGVLSFLVFSFLLLAWYIYRRISTYQSQVELVYQGQMHKLDESENRFRLLYEKAPLAYQSLDINGNILSINEMWSQELGYTQDEVIGRNFIEFIPLEYKEAFSINFPKLKDKGILSGIEFEMLHKDGYTIFVSYNGKVTYTDNDDLMTAHCIFTNITEQKKLQEELTKSHDYLKSIFDVTPNIMITTDGEALVNTNPAMLDFFAYENIETFKKDHNCICDYFLGEDDCLTAKMGDITWLEYIHKNPSKPHKVCMLKGTEKHHFIVLAKPLPIDKEPHSLVSFLDVTQIENIRERFEFAVSGTQDGLWDWDLLSNEIYLSPRWKEMLGYKDDEMASSLQAWKDKLHPNDIAQALEDISTSHNNPDIFYENIHRLKHKDGHWVWILDRGQTHFNQEGKPVRMVGYQTDISEQKRLEHELIESKRQFELFMNNIPAAITMQDENNRILYANELTLNFFNKPSIYGKNPFDVLPKDIANKFNILNNKAKEEGYAEEVIEMTSKKGNSIFLRSLIFAITQKDEKIHTGSTFIDITDKYKDQHKITQLTTAVESAPISIMITDLSAKIEYVNPWFVQLTGYSLQECLGEKPSILKSQFTSQEEYKTLWETISKGEVWSGTFKNIKKDKSEYWESAIIAPIVNDKGDILNYIAIKQEITEQVYLKEELIQQADRNIELGAILEDVANEIYIFSKKKQKFLYVNKEALRNIGYSPDELYKMSPLDLKPQMKPELYNSMLNDLSQKKLEKVFFKTPHRRKDKSTYPADIYLQETVFEGNDVYMCVVIDATEQEKAQEELHNQEEIMIAQSRHAAMGEMIGMIAHQWRQPITVIAMGANNMLADIALENVDEQEFVIQSQSILKQTEYLSKTIDDFRNFFRPNKEMEEVRLENIMLEAEKIIGQSLKHNSIALKVHHDNGLKIKTYSRELLQVYINLLKNAKEALVDNKKDKREINVEISDNDETIITTICDNGGGIDDEIIEKVFDPYFSTKDEKSGTGLGLYMSKTIIEKHLHGQIEVHNTQEGVCFTISLPITKDTHE